MRPFFKLTRLIWMLISFALVWHSIPVKGNTAFAFEVDEEKILWDHLSYRAKSIFGKVSTEVHFVAVPVEETAALLIKDPAGVALQPAGETIFTLTVVSNINPLFGSDEILKTKSWFDPNGAGALQRVRLRQGQDKWHKSYRFTKKGVFRLRKEPKDSREEDWSWYQWTKTKASFYPFDAAGMGCFDVLEPSGLLMIASVLELLETDTPLHLCVFNKKQLHQVKVSVNGPRRLKLNYLEISMTKQTRRNRSVDAIKISFQPRPLNLKKNEEPEDFSFLGLKGDFDIYVDPDSRLPVQVSGKISTVGKLDIRLIEVELKY